MSTSRSSCTECSRLRQNSMKLRMDIASLQASNRALIDKQKTIEQQIKQQKLQQHELCLATTPGLVDAACAEELDRVKSEYFSLRQEAETLRENLRVGEQQRSEAERRAVDAENWIQIKDSIIEKQRNLLKEIESNKAELQAEMTSAKTSSQQAQQELSRRLDELANYRLEIQRLEEAVARSESKEIGAESDETKEGLKDETKSLRQQLEKTRADLLKAEASRRASVNDLAASKRRVALKEASVKSLQAALEAEKASAAHEENAHALLDSENAYLRSENSSLKEESERATATIAGLESRVAELEAELNSKTESAAEMAAEMEAMTEALQEKQEKLGDLDKRARCTSQGEGESGGATPGGSADLGNEDSCTGPPQPGEEACLAAVSEKITRQETQIGDLNALLSYRESCILKMHDEMGKLRTAIDVANTEKDTLNASITILKKELAQAREKAKERKEAMSDVESKMEEIRQKRCREYDRRKRAEVEADELYRENDELRHRVAKLEANLKQSSESSQKSRDPGITIQITELQSQVKDLRTDNEAKRSELFDTRSKLEEKLSAIEEIQTKLKTKDRTVTELRNQIYTIQSSAGTHQDELKSVRAELSRVMQQHKRAKQDLSSILASNRYLSESCNDMRAKLKDKERQISEQNEKMQSLTRAANETPSGANSGVDSSSSSSQNKAGPSTASERSLDAESEPRRLQESLEAMEVKLKQLIEEKHRQAQENAEARSKLLDLELKLTAARSDVTKFSAAADANQSQVQRLQADLSRLKNDATQQTEEMRHLLSDKDSQLTRKRKREEELVEQIEKEKRRRLENGKETSNTLVCPQCDLLGREITNVESYINQKDEEFSNLTEQLLEMKQQDSSIRSDLTRSNIKLQESQLLVCKLETELAEEKAKSRSLKDYQEHADELMRALRQANLSYEHQMTKMQKGLSLG